MAAASRVKIGGSVPAPTTTASKVAGAGFAASTVKVFESGDGIGGTWFWNRYPGA